MSFLGKLRLGKISELTGVDIGTSSIKICTLKSSPTGFRLVNTAKRHYQEDLLNEGYVVDKDFVAQELKDIFAENKIKSKNAVCALSSYVVITKVVTIPFLKGEELENTISFEVENAIPFPLKDVYYSYYVLGADPVRQDMISVQIAAAKKEIVDGYIDAFKSAGLSLNILDVDIFGITNLVEQIYSPKDMSVLVVDIGASTTNMAIVRDTNIQFTREILLGGRYLTKRIGKTLQLTYQEAEARKIAGDDTVSNLFEDFIYNISSEINKTINFYVSIKPKETISKIYLTGGSSLLRGLKEQIADDTRVDVAYVDPFLILDRTQGTESYIEEDIQHYGIALYLSTRMVDLGI